MRQKKEAGDPGECNPKIGVDANHNGVISFGPEDNTSASNPYQFWINNDNDGDSAITYGEPLLGEELESSTPDFADSLIRSRRDLEDFARIRITFCTQLQQLQACGYRLKMQSIGALSSTPLKFFKAIRPGMEYLTDGDLALAQLVGSYSVKGRTFNYNRALDPNNLSAYLTD